MPPQPSTALSLRAENAELRALLKDAEEMLRAIRAGEVDALVAEGHAGPRLFTPQGLDAGQNCFRGEMLAQVSDAVIAVDTEERITFLNAAAERLYGVQAGNMLGRKLAEIFTRHWPSPEEEAAAGAALREHGKWHGEYLQRTRQGRELHVDSSMTLLRDSQREIIGRLSAIRDITARRAAEEEMRYREQLHRIAFDQAPTGMVFAGLDGRFIQVNARMCEITGYSAEELVRMNISDLTYPEDRESDAPLMDSLHSGTTPQYENEKRYVCKGGIIRWVTVSAHMVNDGAGRPLHTVGVIHDITARKETEAALRLTNERLTLAVKCSQVVLFQQDLELRYIWHRNPELGLKFSDFIGKRDADLMERATDAAVTEGLKREVIRTGVGQRQEVLVKIQGVDRHYDLLVEPQRDAAGLISGVTCAAIDITARKETEAALRLTNERLTLAVKCSQVVLWQQDLELCYTWLHNSSLGIDGSNAVGKGDADLLDRAEDAALTEALKREVIRSGVSQRQEVMVHIAGVGRHYDLLMEPLRDAAGFITGITGAAVDITERKRAETAQRETERDYRALADASLEVPYRMSADWSTMLPLDGREVLASSDGPLTDWGWVNQYLPCDEHARVRQTVSDAIARKKLFEMEHRVLRLDGSIGWVRSRSVPILDENEEVIAWFGAATDITLRKQAEEAQRLLASIVENSRDFIGISDTLGNPVYGNRAAMELVGVQDLAQLRRSKIIDYFIPEQRPFVEGVVLPTVATDGRWSGELTMQHFVTGAKIPVWYDLFRVDDPATGQPVNFATITHDLTEVKHTGQALREKAHFLQRIAEVTPGVLHIYDLAERRAVFINRSVTSLLGYSPEEVLAMGANATPSLMHPEDLPRFDEYMARLCALADGEVAQFEFQMRNHAGAWHWFLSHGSVFLRDATGAARQTINVSSEITERKRAEQTLAERTELLNGVLEGTTDVIFVKDLNGRMLLANAAFAAAARSTPEQLVGKTDGDWFPPDVAAAARQQDEAVIASGSPMQFEETVPVAGEARSFLTLKAPLRDGGSRVVGILGIGRDITERKQAEAAVARLAAIVESSHDALFGEDLDGIITSWNPGAEQIFGYRADEIVGTSILRLIPEGRQDEEHALQRKLAAGERGGTFEGIRRDKDGREFHASITISPLVDAAGKVIGTSRVVRNITERKCAEEALRAGEERMRLATEATEVGIWEWNVLTSSLRWDAQMFQLYGVAPTADGLVSYETWSSTVLPEDLAQQEEVLQETMRRCGKSTREFRILRADNGECRCIQAVETVRTNEEGKAEWVIGTNLDVTEQKNAERAIREASEKAVAANAAKDRFLAALSHELRTPLTPVLLVSEVHAKSKQLPDDLREDFEMIHRNIVLEAQLIDDLLDVSRIQQGKMRFDFKPVDVHEAIACSLEMLRREVEEKGITVRQELGTTPATIEADPTRLRQVLCNLLRNAVKFTPSGGTITVQTSCDFDELQISVADTGAGIAAEDLERIFQPFEQVDAQQKCEHQSLGLGLAISAAIVAAHRGRIWAESSGPSQGATFRVQLPF